MDQSWDKATYTATGDHATNLKLGLVGGGGGGAVLAELALAGHVAALLLKRYYEAGARFAKWRAVSPSRTTKFLRPRLKRLPGLWPDMLPFAKTTDFAQSSSLKF